MDRFTRALVPFALLLGSTSSVFAQVTVNHHSGLAGPMGVQAVQDSAFGSGFLASEAGTGANDSRVTFLEDGSNDRQTVVEGLPSAIAEGFPSGAHDATLSGTSLFVALGGSGHPELHSTVVRFDLNATPWAPGLPPLTTADIAEIIPVSEFVFSNGYGDSNVFSMVLGGNDDLFIVDSGANAIIRYDSASTLSVYADIPGESNPTQIGPPVIQSVPTQVRWDGTTLRVSTLTGFPFVPGLAKIYAVTAPQTLEVEKDGLSLVTSFDYDPTNGRLVVAEFASSFDPLTGFAPFSGSIVEFNETGQAVPISVGAHFPTSIMHKPDGTPFFTCTGTGVLNRIDPGVLHFGSTSPNSVGSGALISHAGSVSIQANDFTLKCEALPVGQFGLFYYGTAPTDVPFGDGRRCVGGPELFRLDVMTSDGAGVAFYPVDNTTLMESGTFSAGSIWQFQYWYRDPSFGVAGFNLSDGLQAMFAD